MTADRTEDRYLNEMYNCDAAFVLFKNVAGKYTCEEFEKACAKEQEGTARLKIHQVLFHAQGAPDSDAAKLKETLPAGSYSVWSDTAELKKIFLSFVDRVAERPNLIEIPSHEMRTVSAFIAADDELAADRNAFADAVLNLKNGEYGREYVTARDNVIFELGLCSMALGDKRVIIVHHKDVRLIDDLRGYGEAAQGRIRSGEIGFEDTVLASSNVI